MTLFTPALPRLFRSLTWPLHRGKIALICTRPGRRRLRRVVTSLVDLRSARSSSGRTVRSRHRHWAPCGGALAHARRKASHADSQATQRTGVAQPSGSRADCDSRAAAVKAPRAREARTHVSLSPLKNWCPPSSGTIFCVADSVRARVPPGAFRRRGASNLHAHIGHAARGVAEVGRISILVRRRGTHQLWLTRRNASKLSIPLIVECRRDDEASRDVTQMDGFSDCGRSHAVVASLHLSLSLPFCRSIGELESTRSQAASMLLLPLQYRCDQIGLAAHSSNRSQLPMDPRALGSVAARRTLLLPCGWSEW